MIIYYTHHFSNQKGESHKLLEKAVAGYLGSFAGDAFAAEKAHRLVSGLMTSGGYGKPYIPAFAPFSISHSLSSWAVLISDQDGNCGLDIQYERKADAEAISKRFFAPEDAGIIEKLGRNATGSSEAAHEFFRLWARREALIKAIGTSVTDSGIPAVSSGQAVYCGRIYTINDVKIPAEDRLHVSVCAEDYNGDSFMPELIEL